MSSENGLRKCSLIVALSRSRAIGKKNDLPWKDTPLKKDLNYFKRKTTETSNTNLQNSGNI